MLREEFIHFVWKYLLFDVKNCICTNGDPIGIISQGRANTDSGPDFFAAKIRHRQTLWAGNIEIHIRSSDWNKHRHTNDPAYGNVLLHVVWIDDQPVYRSDGSPLLTLVLKDLVHPGLLPQYEILQSALYPVPCHAQLNSVDPFVTDLLMSRMGLERIEARAEKIRLRLSLLHNDWSQVLYEQFFRAFGSGINADAFEQLARQVPLRYLQKDPGNRLVTESLLFGTAGFLGEGLTDAYPQKLRKEYIFQKRKYGLRAMDVASWKFARMRPAGFPTIRIAQLAAIILSRHEFTIGYWGSFHDLVSFRSLFDAQPDAYWEDHFVFDKKTASAPKQMGRSMVDSILVNALFPVLFSFAQNKNEQAAVEQIVGLLEQLAPEQNKTVGLFSAAGARAVNALQSQGLLQLKNAYCDQKKCLNCTIGMEILKKHE